MGTLRRVVLDSRLLLSSFQTTGLADPERSAAYESFAVIAAGRMGSVVADVLADQIRRTMVTIASLLISATCCLLAGKLFGAAPWILVLLGLVCGFTIVAYSAQFLASVSDLSNPRYVGKALALQTCLGFLLTLVSI